MCRLGSKPRLVGRIGSGVRVSDSFHILSCVVVCAVVRSDFSDTHSCGRMQALREGKCRQFLAHGYCHTHM